MSATGEEVDWPHRSMFFSSTNHCQTCGRNAWLCADGVQQTLDRQAALLEEIERIIDHYDWWEEGAEMARRIEAVLARAKQPTEEER